MQVEVQGVQFGVKGVKVEVEGVYFGVKGVKVEVEGAEVEVEVQLEVKEWERRLKGCSLKLRGGG